MSIGRRALNLSEDDPDALTGNYLPLAPGISISVSDEISRVLEMLAKLASDLKFVTEYQRSNYKTSVIFDLRNSIMLSSFNVDSFTRVGESTYRLMFTRAYNDDHYEVLDQSRLGKGGKTFITKSRSPESIDIEFLSDYDTGVVGVANITIEGVLRA